MEAALLSKHAEKKSRDYAANECFCWQWLFRRSQCTRVCIDDFPDVNVWLALRAFHIMSNPDREEDDKVYVCNHCKKFIKCDTMPPRYVLNGLAVEPGPPELKHLDLFSLQLIQLAKSFMTVVRLKSYSNKKFPTYNSLKACKGNVFVLPMPLQNTSEELQLTECGLPKPELYVRQN